MKIRIVENNLKTKEDKSRVLLLVPSEGEATAEDMAMLQALYSRDPRPIDDAVRLAKTSKSGEFMNKFYVGYGHASIAECGSFVLAIENVPIIIAKLIQHNQLYKGQECSTRYLDFSKQEFVSSSELGLKLQEELRSFYMKWLPNVTQSIINKFNLDPENTSDIKTAKAAGFDVMRGFLPIGACTNLSWATDIKTFNDHVARLRTIQNEFYGLKQLLDKMVELVKKEFPNSVFESRDDNSLRKYKDHSNLKELFTTTYNTFNLVTVNLKYVEFGSIIDFASWRDLARHRSVYQFWPEFKLNLDSEMNNFYLENIPYNARLEFEKLFFKIRHYANHGEIDVYDFPMGINIAYHLTGELEKINYIIKLRTTHEVHPTLRFEMLKLAELTDLINTIRPENRINSWIVSTKRGNQNILKK